MLCFILIIWRAVDPARVKNPKACLCDARLLQACVHPEACTSNASFANSTTRPTFADTHSHTGSCYSRRPISHRQIIHYWWASESSSCPFFVHIAGEKITSPTLITDEELAPVCCSFIFFVTVNQPEILKMHWKKKRRTWSSMTRWFVYSIHLGFCHPTHNKGFTDYPQTTKQPEDGFTLPAICT